MATNEELEMLLAFYWMTQKEKDVIITFPELFCFDITENTNLEK